MDNNFSQIDIDLSNAKILSTTYPYQASIILSANNGSKCEKAQLG